MLGAIYARYSNGPNQTEQSIEGQVADCRAYAEREGIQIVELYIDRHISGKSIAGREEFQRMLRDAERHRFECVIVWKIDRFGRNRQDIALSKLKLKRAGVQLRYAVEAVPDGPEGIILESVLEGLAEYYSADLRQKIVRGVKETAKKGQYCCRLPFGYKLDKDRRIIPDPEKAPLVREIFRMHNAGAGSKEIIAYLWSRGIATKKGAPVSKNMIYSVLRNERYLGRFVLHGIEVPAEPIIDQETYDRAVLTRRPISRNAAGGAKVNYLLSCKCYCGYCGALLNGDSVKNKKGVPYYYYTCGTRKKGGKCELKSVPKDQLERAVIEATMKVMLEDEMIDRITERVMQIQQSDAEADPATELKRLLEANRKKQKNIVSAIEEGTGTKMLTKRLEELEAAAEDLEVEIRRAEIEKPLLTEELVKSWLLLFRDGDIDDEAFRRRLIDTFIARVEVTNEEARIYCNIREKGPHASVSARNEEWTVGSLALTPIDVSIINDFIVISVPLK